MALPKPKINSNWLLLIAAVGLGIGSMYLANTLLTRRMNELEQAATKGRQLVQVVVATRDLERGASITEDVVAVRGIPREYVHSSAILPDRFETVERQRLAAPIKRGEPLLSTHLEGSGAQ